jgi:hypothetical protein
MTDRGFTHPNFGSEARVEQYGREVHIVFVAGTQEQSNSMCKSILAQLQAGALNITMMGKPTSVEEI